VHSPSGAPLVTGHVPSDHVGIGPAAVVGCAPTATRPCGRRVDRQLRARHGEIPGRRRRGGRRGRSPRTAGPAAPRASPTRPTQRPPPRRPCRAAHVAEGAPHEVVHHGAVVAASHTRAAARRPRQLGFGGQWSGPAASASTTSRWPGEQELECVQELGLWPSSCTLTITVLGWAAVSPSRAGLGRQTLALGKSRLPLLRGCAAALRAGESPGAATARRLDTRVELLAATTRAPRRAWQPPRHPSPRRGRRLAADAAEVNGFEVVADHLLTQSNVPAAHGMPGTELRSSPRWRPCSRPRGPAPSFDTAAGSVSGRGRPGAAQSR